MPHSTQNRNIQNNQNDQDTFCMEKLLNKCALLLREQELFLRDLESFKRRLERVEAKIISNQKRK